MRARIIISLGILLLVSVTAWGKEEKAAPLRCIVTGNVPVDYLSPEQSSFWALCVDIGGKRVSDSRFPQSAVVGKDSFSLSDEVMQNSNPTMKLTYTAEDRSSKRLTIFRKGGYHIYPRWEGVTNLDGMGVWVYGNGSGDLLEYVDTWGNVYDPKKITFRKAITWKGWKFLELPYNKRHKRFWGITISIPEGSAGSRAPLYFAGLNPRQRKVFPATEAGRTDPFQTRVDGLDFAIFLKVPAGRYEVEIAIEPPFNKRMNKHIGFHIIADSGREVFTYKPGKRGGPWWHFPVKVSNSGILKLRVQSQKQCKAWVNALRLWQGGRPIAEFNLGFNAKGDAYFADGVNLVPNPGFEVVKKTGFPVGWKTKSGTKDGSPVSVDDKISHSGRRSLRISAYPQPVEVESTTCQFWPVAGNNNYGAAIDYTRSYTLSAWVRSENVVGRAHLELVWNRIKGEIVQGRDKQGNKYPRWSNAATIEQLGMTESEDFVGGDGKWRLIQVSTRPPYGADHVTFRINTEMKKGTVWVDDLRFYGFGDAPVELIACQGGYYPSGSKRVIVALRDKLDGQGIFIVTPVGRKTPVYRGKLSPWGKDEWGRDIRIADFSNFRKEGKYELTVSFPGGPVSKSHPFSISRTHYITLVNKVRHYLYVARCGMAITGWHKACHLDDAVERRTGKHYDMTGGWHDAGSLDKQMRMASLIIVHLSTIALESFDLYPPVTVDNLKLPDVLDEALWGAEQLLKMQLPDGRIYVAVLPSRGGLVNSTNNIPGDDDDRYLVGPYGAPRSVMLLAWSRTARVLKLRKDSRLIRYMKALKLSYPVMREDSGAAQVDLDMWRLTGDRKYLRKARSRVKVLLAGLRKQTYYWKVPDYDGLISLIEYARAVPESNLSGDIKAEVAKFIDGVLEPFTRYTPYGQVMKWDVLFPHAIGGQGGGVLQNNKWLENYDVLKTAYFLTEAYRLLGNKKYLELADAQLQWVMGRNPTGGSMIAGVGYKFQMPTTAISYTNSAHRNGLITGAVLRACAAGNGKLTERYGGGLPRWFPVIYTSSDVPGNMFAGGEIWTPVSAEFMRVSYELDRALETGR